MSYSFATTTADGISATVAVPFSYISKKHVHVYLNDVETDQSLLVWPSSSTITLPSIPAAGVSIRVSRATPLATPLVTFVAGALSHTDLNTNTLQLLDVIQEQVDAFPLLQSFLGSLHTVDVAALTADVAAAKADLALYTGTGKVARWLNPVVTTPRIVDTRTVGITTGGAALWVTSDNTNGINDAYVWSAVNLAVADAGSTTRYDGIRAIVVVPSGATKSSSAISAYMISKYPGDIGYTLEMVADADNVNLWGFNFLLTDRRGQVIDNTKLGRALNGGEIDLNFTSTATKGFGLMFGGNSLVQPNVATAILCNRLDGYPGTGTVAHWSNFLQAVDGATGVFATIGATSNVSGARDSQTLEFHAYTGGTSMTTANLQWLNNKTFACFMPVGGTFEVGVDGVAVSTFNAAGSSIRGTTTNDLALGGQIGEYITASGPSTNINTSSTTAVASVILSRGEWDVVGYVAFVPAGGSIITTLTVSLDTASAGGEGQQYVGISGGSTYGSCLSTGVKRFSFAADANTVHVNGYIAFTIGTMTTVGFIRARRVR